MTEEKIEKKEEGKSAEWIRELTSSLSREYKKMVDLAREELFDIFSLTPHQSLPETYVATDVLNNEIALVWIENGKVKVEVLSQSHIKRMN